MTYMIHFRNFFKRGTKIFLNFFFNIDTYVNSIFKRKNFFLQFFDAWAFVG